MWVASWTWWSPYFCLLLVPNLRGVDVRSHLPRKPVTWLVISVNFLPFDIALGTQRQLYLLLCLSEDSTDVLCVSSMSWTV